MNTAQHAKCTATRRSTMPSGWKAALVSAGGAALVTACASVGSSSTGAPASPTGVAPAPSAPATASAALPCKQITSLRTSLTELSRMTGRTVLATQIASSVARAQHELTELSGQAGAFSARATELQGELSQIGNEARTLAMHPSSSDMHDLNAAVKELRSHAAPLIGQMQAVCPH